MLFGVLTWTKDWIEPILTTRPRFARSWRRKARVTLNTPSRLTRMMSSQSPATISASPVTGLRRLMPALLTRIEIAPTEASMSLAAATQAARSRTSSVTACAACPAAAISSRTAPAAPPSMSIATTSAPCSA